VSGGAAARREAAERPDMRIGALGSGSDFTPFLQHMGIASLNLGFGGESGGGSYHSIYDSFDHYSRFGDTDFAYGVTLSKVCGRAVLRLANADTLPFEFTNFADTIGTYVNEVTRLTDTMREETLVMNKMIESGMLKAVQDPRDQFVLPAAKGEVPKIDFTPLQNALKRVQASADAYQKASAGKTAAGGTQKQLDEILINTERTLTSSDGLPRRDWFRHQIYAPGFYTGYGVKTLPGVREALEQRDWKEAREQIDAAARTLERFAAEIDRAAKLF
jgi:N-acetylated-alpha-linked acidic dipeptidase